MAEVPPARLGDFVWEDLDRDGQQDAGEPGIPDVVVHLKDATNTIIATTTTNASGLYLFENLVPGTYSVQFEKPAGYEYTLLNVGSDVTDSDADDSTMQMTHQTTLPSGGEDLTLDAGLYQPAAIGDFVWEDLNANGIQDAGEPGIPGVTVNLYDCITNALIGTTATDASGLYLFSNLTPGTYHVEFVAPAGYVFSPQDQGVNDAVDSDANPATGQAVCTVLTSGETDLTWDAGLYQPAAIGDFVWEDLNANGIQDAGEPGIPGVTVNLYDCITNALIGTTSTDASGLYLFSNLTPGTYHVEFVAPAGYVFSPQDQGVNDAVDSDANPATGQAVCTVLTSGETDLTWDAGLYQPAAIGDFVWEDLNANGIQDAGEPGIPGVTVNLYDCITNALIGTTATDASGLYLFSNLTPGTYHVEFVAPAGYVFSPQDQGVNDAVDSDANPATGQAVCTVLTSGETDLTWDAGLYQPARLGDFVWEDLDRDGQQEAGEPGIPGVVVHLKDATNTIIATTTTNASGLYLFENLVPGTYSVQFEKPAGYEYTLLNVGSDVTDSDADDSTMQMTHQTTLPSGGEDLTLDAGLFRRVGDIDIEKFVKVVTAGTEGLTPGYWKQDQHFDDWTNYVPTDIYNTVFGVSDTAGMTLLDALQRGGGGLNALGRHAVAALLNAAHPNLDYAYTEAQVIAMTQAAYASGDPDVIENTKNLFAVQNELEGDISSGGGGGVGVGGIGDDADVPTGPTAQLGQQIMFTYLVTNPGELEISNVVVVDDNATPGNPADDFSPTPVLEGSGFNTGDDDQDNLLDVGETWVYTAMITATATGQFKNISVVTGQPVDSNGNPVGGTVTDDDPAHYIVPANPGIDIIKYTNGVDANTEAEAPEIAPGDVVTWTYKVTNTGDVPFTSAQVQIVDDAGTPGDASDDFSTTSGDIVFDAALSAGLHDGDGLLEPSEMWIYKATGIAQDLGTSVGGLPVSTSLMNQYLLIGTTSNSIAKAVNVQNGELGADAVVLSTEINDNVDFDLKDVFLNTTGNTPGVWVDDDPGTLPGNPDFLPGAAGVHQGISWTGDVALTSPNAAFDMSNVELFGQVGVVADSGSPVSSVSNSYFFPNGVGGDAANPVGGQNLPPNGVTANADAAMAALRAELDAFEDFVTNLAPEVTLSGGSGLPDFLGIENEPVFTLNIDPFDTNGDGVAVIDILIDNGNSDFAITNSNWIIDGNGSTFAIFRILGNSNLVLNQSTIVIGDGGIGGTGLGAIFIKANDYSNGQGGFNAGESLSSGDTVFSFNDTVLNGVGFYDLIVFDEQNTDAQFDNGTTELKINNGQGCAHFISPKINFNDIRFERCDLPQAAVEPGCYENYAVVTVPGATDTDLSHYCNPEDQNPGIDLEKFTNGVDADSESEAPEITPGDVVTWTYKVTNTGDVPFTSAQVQIVDDAGTPGDTGDDFSTTSGDIVFDAALSTGLHDGDGLLEPGEMWIYKATGIAQDLPGGSGGGPSTFNFNGSSPTDGTDGNIRTFTSGSLSVKTSAFSRDKSTGAWSAAYLGAYSGGLGVTDSSEGSGGSDMHTVDNVGRNNYVLFEFSDTVVVDSAFLGYVVNDSDLSLWIGTATDPFNNHITLSDAVLSSLGFTEVNETTLTGTRTADLNAGGVAGNVLVIAAWTGDTTPEDRFKIGSVTVQQPAPGCYENRAVVTSPGATDSDNSFYCNPVAPPGKVCGTVWKDANKNGKQNSGEYAFSSVTVKLWVWNTNTNSWSYLSSTTTDSCGNYCFENLGPGDYKIQVVKPYGWYFTTQNVYSNAYDSIDSDVNSSGYAYFTLAIGECEDIDAGLRY